MRDAPSAPGRRGLRCRCGAGLRGRLQTRRRHASATTRASRAPPGRADRRRSGALPARSPAARRAGRGLARWLLGLIGRRVLGGSPGVRRLSLGLRAAALAPPPSAPLRAAAALLRCGEVLRERERDLLDRAEPLARLVDELRRARRVPLRRRQERGAHGHRPLGRGRGQELLERRLARAPVRQLLDERSALVEADLAAGDHRPGALLVLVEVLRIYALPLALDDAVAAADVRRDRYEPRRRREAAARAALRAAARRGSDARPLAVEVGVEKRVQ